MQTIIDALREIIGNPEFYVRMGSQQNYTWDYGAMLEYFGALMLVLIVVGSIFKLLVHWASGK